MMDSMEEIRKAIRERIVGVNGTQTDAVQAEVLAWVDAAFGLGKQQAVDDAMQVWGIDKAEYDPYDYYQGSDLGSDYWPDPYDE